MPPRLFRELMAASDKYHRYRPTTALLRCIVSLMGRPPISGRAGAYREHDAPVILELYRLANMRTTPQNDIYRYRHRAEICYLQHLISLPFVRAMLRAAPKRATPEGRSQQLYADLGVIYLIRARR